MRFRWQRGWGGNRTSLPYLVFILSLAATVCAWVWADLLIGNQDRDRFKYATDQTELSIKGKLDDQVDLLLAGAAAFAVQGSWSGNQFHTYIDNLGLGTNFKGAQGIGFIKRTPQSELASLEARLRAEGDKSFNVHPAPKGPVSFPVLFMEPETDENARSIGFDASSDPVRRDAMNAACDTGQPTISGVVDAAGTRQRGRLQSVFLLYCPLYEGGETPSGVEERRQKLIGFLYSRLRANDIFKDVLEGEARYDLDIDIFDVTYGVAIKRFYTSSRLIDPRKPSIVFDGQIPVHGRQWMIRYKSSKRFEEQSAGWLVSLIPFSGLAITALLTAISFSQVRAYRQKETELEERRKAEALVRRLNENLEQIVEERTTELKATNHELEAFCYSVSHDLRAPLRSVDGFSKSLLEDYKDQLDDQARDYIARVRNASQRMDELISALLNLSRITRLEIVRASIDLTQLAKDAMEDALEGIDEGRVNVLVQQGMTVDADPRLTRVLLDNLIRNAVKFSGKKDCAKIEAGFDGSAFFVRDNGVGFNPAYADKLFVAFERLHSQREFPGSGIGLATVHRIVQRHGGRVWAETVEGQGATFYFTLR